MISWYEKNDILLHKIEMLGIGLNFLKIFAIYLSKKKTVCKTY